MTRFIAVVVLVPQVIFPPEDLSVTFTNFTSSVQLMCSLNIIIPPNVTVIWSHNSIPLTIIEAPNEITTAGNTTTLVIGDPRPSDAGVYRCSFIGLSLVRSIILG